MVLPVMLLVYSPESLVRKVALKMYLPYDEVDAPKNSMIKFSTYSINHAIKGKKLITILLTGKRIYSADFRDERFNAKMNFVAKELERLQFTNDTSSVLRVALDSDCEYGDFVHLVNLTIIFEVKRWAYSGDSFYFFPNEPPASLELSPQYPLSAYTNDRDIEYESPNNWELLKWRIEYAMEEWKSYFRHNYLLTGAFILLILFPGILGARRIRRAFPSAVK